MAIPLREAVLRAVFDRLAAAVPTATVERARRAPPDDAEIARLGKPLLHIIGGDFNNDDGQAPGEQFWSVAFRIEGWCRATTGLDAETAIADLHAQAVAALLGRTFAATAPLSDVTLQETTMALLSAEESSVPSATFSSTLTALAVAPYGSPYTT